jgi:hypothetical protein
VGEQAGFCVIDVATVAKQMIFPSNARLRPHSAHGHADGCALERHGQFAEIRLQRTAGPYIRSQMLTFREMQDAANLRGLRSYVRLGQRKPHPKFLLLHS